ncbi:MAG TPA: aminotransferase class V-fold PLP-dependent enzyme [Planctomycetota bacterium]|nr:aminotransferase class V-fold PLP-dependent enzyme [Planctomycetota bacterium]
MSSTIYLDHAATSWPKPDAVGAQIARLLREVTANPGRSGHRPAIEAARLIFDVRTRLAALLGVPDPADLVFTRGATEGLNLVLKGLLRAGDRVGVSPLEHNSVMRPLTRLAAERGVVVETLPADALGRIDVAAASRLAGRYRLVAVAHASNVAGVVQDVRALAKALPGTAVLSDAAQTAGVLPIAVEADGVAFLACSAHKGLLGPTGVGACYLSPGHQVLPLVEGGTGSQSESIEHPAFRPDRYEAGTPNLHGIAGLGGGLEHIERQGLLGGHTRRLASLLIEGLRGIRGVRLYSPADGSALLVSFTIEGVPPDRVAAALEAGHGILCRPGLHCAPSAHRHLGTLPAGTVRLSPGFGNTEEEIEQAVRAVHAIAAKKP